jgi:hypothetical protein
VTTRQNDSAIFTTIKEKREKLPSLLFLSFISGRQMGRNVQIHPSGKRGEFQILAP